MEPKGSQMERKWSSKRAKLNKKNDENEVFVGVVVGVIFGTACHGFYLKFEVMYLIFLGFVLQGSAGIRKDLVGFARIHWDSRGFVGIRCDSLDSLGFARVPWGPPGSLGFARVRWGFASKCWSCSIRAVEVA